jgi:phospholipid/cholesterol/gamma-HCH transport system substrate-binding protein
VTETKHETFVAPKRKLTTEFFVGIFAIAGVACFAYLAVGIAGMRFFDTGFYRIIAEFDNVAGLEKGAPVEIAGVPVGEVMDISLKETMAYVTMSIRKEVEVRSDDIASIRTKGIIGDRYVKLSPGAGDQKLSDGASLLDTESAVDLEDVIGKLIHRME